MAYSYVFCSKNILTKLVGYQQPIVSVLRWNSWLEPFRFHVKCIHFRGAVFVHLGSAQLCTGNGVSIYMCSAVEVAWLAQNIRHSSTRVHERPQKIFQGGGQSRNFVSAYLFRLVNDPTKMDVHKALHPFCTTKKTPKITATVANRVIPLRKFYTEQMFVLMCMDSLRLS